MSQKLNLGFIEKSPFSPTNFSFLGVAVLILGLVLIFFTWQQYQSGLLKHNEVLLKLEQFNTKPQKQELASRDDEEIPIEIKTQIKATVADLMIPWNALMEEIEQSDTSDVALLSLEPSRKKQQVILAGEARNLQSVMQYISRLEEQSMLSQVYIQKHSVDEVNVSKPVRFTLVAQWHTFIAN